MSNRLRSNKLHVWIFRKLGARGATASQPVRAWLSTDSVRRKSVPVRFGTVVDSKGDFYEIDTDRFRCKNIIKSSIKCYNLFAYSFRIRCFFFFFKSFKPSFGSVACLRWAATTFVFYRIKYRNHYVRCLFSKRVTS